MASKGVGDVKLREFGTWFSQNFRPSILRERLGSTYNGYVSRHFAGRKTRITPFIHFVMAAVVLNYCIEYRHIKHDRHRKYH